ncbi:MAG TPA: Amuc_1099 family pilus-like system protein, partial [Chthoniobacteraceae bacterium]|nr:Amuc_1099 family pilus-like system protein [Chthoniobacteraceae bacterium]
RHATGNGGFRRCSRARGGKMSMDWIKKNPDQFALALLAFLLLACSGWIIFRALHFNDTFSATAMAPPRKDTVPPVDIASINETQQEADKPAQWIPKGPAGAKEGGSLFVSDKFVLKNDQLVMVTESTTLFRIPTGWKTKYNLNPLDPRVEDEDPDKDGFSNVQEYLGANRIKDSNNPEGDPDSTNPLDPKSHPPYHAVLWLKQWVQQMFQLVMKAWDGDPKDPASLNFQINAITLNTPTQFLKIGDTVAGTKYKIDHFEQKSQLNPATGAMDDVSELTLVNTETSDPVVLVKEKVTNSPDTRGVFQYRWGPTPREFQLQRLQEFALPPNTNEKYKLIDIKETEAVIQLPTGEKVVIPRASQ